MHLNPRLSGEYHSYVDHSFRIDCSLGSNPFGAPEIPEHVVKDIIYGIDKYYCHRELSELTYLTRQFIGIEDCRITYTTGSLGALELIFNKLIDHNNRTMIGIGPQFVEAVSELTLVGGKYQSINMLDYQNESDLFGVLASKISSQNPALVYIDNPNNPTGRIYDRAYLVEIARVCERYGAILIVDEAYGEYLTPEQSMLDQTLVLDNLIVLRTFSKGLGLAGIRLGYLASSENLTSAIEAAVSVFTPTYPSIKIASATLPNAKHFLEMNRSKTEYFKPQMIGLLSEHNIEVVGTSISTPIMLLKKTGTNLSKLFENIGIKTCSGVDFAITCDAMTEEYVRLRIVGNDVDLEALKQRIQQL